jgi:nicotinamide phosphoribosyltransferase
MYHNPLLAIDFYKVDHRRQYPEGTTEIYSNFTPRYVKQCHSLLPDFDNQVVVFGIQSFIKDYLIEQWNLLFFQRDKETVVGEYKDLVQSSLGIENFDCSHIEALHDLGYLPIRIKAIKEGFRVPIGVPVLTTVNTHPDFSWLTNYLETILSASLWKAMTSATIAFEFKRLLTRYADYTGADTSFIPFQAHDFSFRGMSGWNDATLSGAAHLTSFQGTDTVSAIDLLNHHYDATGTVNCVGSSVPATEHSVMCASGAEGEFATIKRLITEVYPEGIVSIVSDSYNFWQTLTVYLPSLYKEINERNGKVVIRPDSGNPVDIICGDMCTVRDTPSHKGALQCLWETFGGRVNKDGYKELNPKVGLIYGDAITVDRAALILQIMEEKGFASSNIIFGVGSYTYQYVTRDTFGFAMKATSGVINGERHAIYKDPITASQGNNKKSARGLLFVGMDDETGKFYLLDEQSEACEHEGHLDTVFLDGKLVSECTLSEIRRNLDIELQSISR